MMLNSLMPKRPLLFILISLISPACNMLNKEVLPTPLITPSPEAVIPSETVVSLQPVTLPPDRETAVPTTTPTSSPTALPTMTPEPTLTPSAVLTGSLQLITFPDLTIVGPLIVDEANGRLFVGAWQAGEPKLAVLEAANGALITTFDAFGPFNLDPQHGRLYIDDSEKGIIILDSATGDLINTIPLPQALYGIQPAPDHPGQPWSDNHTPQIDPVTGQVMVFRNNTLYIANPDTAEILQTITFSVPDITSPDILMDIEKLRYDPAAQSIQPPGSELSLSNSANKDGER